ncbi:YgcG family protein [uncultured Gemmiger sp.]|uniref:TPM domain-containing protein n=1 Tax=uncultured Gemmiger sp. TaxID=1623490 RepID=UPI0025D4361D|nr:TPM domain-containing protein [uncultured Gemmiger sp.]
MKHATKRLWAGAAALALTGAAALPALAAPKISVSDTNAVADHADILSADTEDYINSVSTQLQEACGAQIGVYTLEDMIGNSTMEGVAYEVFNTWGLGDAEQDNGVLLLLAPYEADGGDYYIMRGDGLESQLSYSTLNSILQDDLEPNWVKGDYDTGTQKAVSSIANRLCRIYGVSLSDNSAGAGSVSYDRGGADLMQWILILFAVILVIALITNLMRPGGWGAPRRHRRGPVFFVTPPRRPRRPPPPPPPPRGGYGGYGGFGGFDAPGPRPGGSRPGPRPGGGFSSGPRPGVSRRSGGFGGSRPSGGFKAGGGSSRGGGVGRHR